MSLDKVCDCKDDEVSMYVRMVDDDDGSSEPINDRRAKSSKVERVEAGKSKK